LLEVAVVVAAEVVDKLLILQAVQPTQAVVVVVDLLAMAIYTMVLQAVLEL
jgi:hypothetical protein